MHIEAIASKRLASIYYSNSQSINMDLTSMEQRVDEVIRVYSHKIRATRDSQVLAQEQDHVSDKLYGKLKMTKAMNMQTTGVANARFSRTKGAHIQW